MKPCLIRYYDSRVKGCADITRETAENFATLNGLDFIEESTGSIEVGAYMKKSELVLRELNNGRPYVVWADCDIIFKKTPEETFINTITEPSMSMMNVGGMFETSFFVVNNHQVLKDFIQTWNEYGMSNVGDTDQTGFNTLCQKNRDIKNSISHISADYISPINERNKIGSVGVHCYFSRFKISKPMLELIKSSWYK